MNPPTRAGPVGGAVVPSTTRAPDPVTPWWRDADGQRESLGSLRFRLDGEAASAVGERHVEAIAAVARAAIEAADRGEHPEARRLAHAASRLCQETVGRWPPSAVETPRH